MVRSTFFWTVLLATVGAAGAAWCWFMPGSVQLWSVPIALICGASVGVGVSRRLLRHGPGMLKAVPNLRRPSDRSETSSKPRVLFIVGSMNQTTQMEQIAANLPGVDAFFSPFYSDHWFWSVARKSGVQEFAICGYKRRGAAMAYLTQKGHRIDLHGEQHDYDLVLLCNDHLVSPRFQKRTRRKDVVGKATSRKHPPLVLVQEGIQEPRNWRFYVWRYTRLLHRSLADTSTFGLSGLYDLFCVASEGYRKHFVGLGVPEEKLRVTGMPNFDNCETYRDNSFPHQGYVLVCTSDSRETMNSTDRERHAFLKMAVQKAAGRPLFFKLHPNEKADRATREIQAAAPEAKIFTSGCAEEMVANCSMLITEFSSLTFVGIALGKEVFTRQPIDYVRELCPIQNKCAAEQIADVCRETLSMAATVPSLERSIGMQAQSSARVRVECPHGK